MNQQAEDLMMGSPNIVSKQSLSELGIELKVEKKKKLLNFLLFKYDMLPYFWIILFKLKFF